MRQAASTNLPLQIALLYGLVTFALSLWGAETLTFASLATVPACIAILSLCTYYLLLDKLWPTAAVLIAFGLAYLPRSWDAVGVGMPSAAIPVSAGAVRLALLSLGAMAIAATLVSRLLSRIPALRRAGEALPRMVSLGLKPAHFDIAVVIALAGPTASAIADGSWSTYGWERQEASKASVNLAQIYLPMLVASAAVAGSWLSPALRRKSSAGVGLPTRAVAALALTTLLFLTQSRRLMVGAAVCAVLPAIPYQRWASRKLILRGAVIACCLIGLFYLSHRWRHARELHTQNMSEQIDAMASEAPSDRSTVQQIESRLTYLWIDALAFDMGRTPAPVSVADALRTQLAGAVPGILWPGKYEVMPVTCETVMAGAPMDLACTPVAESMLLGGYTGVLIAMFWWALALGLASLLGRGGSPAGIAVATLAVSAFFTIESSTFPIIPAVRLTLQCSALLILASAVVRVFVSDQREFPAVRSRGAADEAR